MNFDYILKRIADDPISFAISFAILMVALALFIKLAGNPISYFVDLIKKIGPFAFKELRGKAGKAGVVNIIIVFCLTCLAFVILLKRRKQDNEITKAFNELKKAEPESDMTVLPGKLADCQMQGDGELFLVEGISASGSSKQARDRRFQAILPLKGKVLNVLKSNYTTTMKNEVVQDIMIAIGITIKGKNIVINPRYSKIILSCDADEDGKHIACLLLIFFLKWGRPLIEHGHIYMSRLPIFLVRNKKFGSRFVYEEHLYQKKKGDVVSRFKGLGEMNPNELEETLFNIQTRKLEQVKITNLTEASTIAQVLMGSDSEMRASFLQFFSTEYDHINLDI